MSLALQHGKAVVMRPDALVKKGVAVEQQMMSGNGGGNMTRCICDELYRLKSGDMFEDDPQMWKSSREGDQHPVKKESFPVEHIHFGVGDFAMHQQGHAHLFHHFQCSVAPRNIGNARGGVCRRAGGIILHPVYYPTSPGLNNF